MGDKGSGSDEGREEHGVDDRRSPQSESPEGASAEALSKQGAEARLGETRAEKCKGHDSILRGDEMGFNTQRFRAGDVRPRGGKLRADGDVSESSRTMTSLSGGSLLQGWFCAHNPRARRQCQPGAQAVSAGRAGSVSRGQATGIEVGLRRARVNEHLDMLYGILLLCQRSLARIWDEPTGRRETRPRASSSVSAVRFRANDGI